MTLKPERLTLRMLRDDDLDAYAELYGVASVETRVTNVSHSGVQARGVADSLKRL